MPERSTLAGRLAEALRQEGWPICGSEPLKLTLCPKEKGYTGRELEAYLRERNVVCEFADADYLVMMISPENTAEELETAHRFLTALPPHSTIDEKPPVSGRAEKVLTPREALMRPFERISVDESIGRILASPSVGCPPAVPIIVCGERIDEQALVQFRYYGISHCDVIL